MSKITVWHKVTCCELVYLLCLNSQWIECLKGLRRCINYFPGNLPPPKLQEPVFYRLHDWSTTRGVTHCCRSQHFILAIFVQIFRLQDIFWLSVTTSPSSSSMLRLSLCQFTHSDQCSRDQAQICLWSRGFCQLCPKPRWRLKSQGYNLVSLNSA